MQTHFMLMPCRPSPFTAHDNFGGGFVSDNDRVALSSIKFASGLTGGEQATGAYAHGLCGQLGVG